jgi:hypothetical protein
MNSPVSNFVPLIAKAADSSEPFRVKVLAGANGAVVPFRPLVPAPSAAPCIHHEHSSQPKVALVRDGDRITSVRVQCGCGEVIELQCEY